MRAVPWKAFLKEINVHATLPSGAGDRRPDLDAEAAAAVIHAYKDSWIHPEETTRSEGARLLTHRHTSAMCECAKQVKCNSMWDRKKVGSHSLAPVHCDSAAITEHLSTVCARSSGERDRWVKRYIMCPWLLLTLHMHARACQCRYPLGRPSALDTPIRTPWESRLRSRADNNGK